jgi:succinate dehydrogenase/fumarate reductase-like Fe-S protein/flavodoxin/ferredoxin
MVQITTVWIDEGCITCDACADECPEVFEVTDDTCFIKSDVRVDGGYDQNEGKAAIKPEFSESLAEAIIAAADECPVDVIMVVEAGAEGEDSESSDAAAEAETHSESGPIESSAASDSAAAAAREPAATSESDGSSGNSLDSFLTAGDRSLNILFGSQSGNSEGLAAKMAKQAKDFGLEAVVHDMDEFNLASMAGMSRVAIICSTWGEGEMPDNAEELWQQSGAEDAPTLTKTNFTICALGDTSYEFYCQCGKEWDDRLASMGGNRVVDRIDCDVDYDAPAATWISAALIHLAAVNGAGVFQSEMVEDIEAMAAGDVPSGADGDDGFTIPVIVRAEMSIQVEVFRYDPMSGEAGHDVWACTVPGHHSVLDLLRTLKSTQDGTLTFRDGLPDDPTTGIAVNGRLILPGRASIESVVNVLDGENRLHIAPLPGSEVLRDLAIDLTDSDHALSAVGPWFVGATREAAVTYPGAIGKMDAAVATALHIASDIESGSLLDSMSDTTPFNDDYIGPASIVHLWVRAADPRTSDKSRADIIDALSAEGGVKAECDISSISRHGGMGGRAAAVMLEAKTAVLQKGSFRDGRHGNHVRWFTLTVKTSGLLNETMLAGLTLGPIGMLNNVRSGILPRMLLGFTRTGGPMMRDKQALLAGAGIPVSIGKMPKLVNTPVEDHQEVIAIYNALKMGV